MSEDNLYADRDIFQLDIDGNYYCRHVDRMTVEELHSKSDIAAELGWRDREIDNLKVKQKELLAMIGELELKVSDLIMDGGK